MYCLATGWCAFNEQRRFNLGDGSVYAFDYLDKVFFPYHMKQVNFDARFVYESKSDINPYYNHDIPEHARSAIYAKNLKHHFGWFASVMMGGQYCLVNNCDMIYIEQDCLVYGLKEALDWAKGKKIVYGFGDVSWCEGWAEHSFFTVSHEYLGAFLSILNGCRIQENNDILPEVSWHSLFKDVADFWPWGFGRKRPVDFNGNIFYAQQLKKWEIDKFIEKLNDNNLHNKPKGGRYYKLVRFLKASYLEIGLICYWFLLLCVFKFNIFCSIIAVVMVSDSYKQMSIAVKRNINTIERRSSFALNSTLSR